MSRLEESMLRRWSGQQLIAVSIAIGVCGVAPLLLYILFGPADGNPLGLGLLAVAAVPLAAAGMIVGLIKLLARFFMHRGP